MVGLELLFTRFVLAALRSFPEKVIMRLDCLEAFYRCSCDAKEVWKLSSV